MYSCIYVSLCMYVFMYLCICVNVFMYLCIYLCIYLFTWSFVCFFYLLNIYYGDEYIRDMNTSSVNGHRNSEFGWDNVGCKKPIIKHGRSLGNAPKPWRRDAGYGDNPGRV